MSDKNPNETTTMIDMIDMIPLVPDLGDDGKVNDEEWQKIAMLDSPNQFRIRLQRAFFIITAPMILLITSSYINISVSSIIGIALLFMYIIWFITLFRLVFIFGNVSPQNDGDVNAFNGEYKLYRIYSMSQRPKTWAANLDISYIQLLFKKHSIQSISELCAVHGGVTKSMLNTLGAYTWCAVTIHYIEQIKNSDTFIWDISDYCTIIGTVGLLLISIFELDPFNAKMRFIHNFGALCGSGTVFGFNLQQYSHHNGQHFTISITLAIICFIGFISWNVTQSVTDLCQLPTTKTERGGENYRYIITPFARLLTPYDRKRNVSLYSRMNIGFEAIFLFIGALCLCLFLMDYDKK